MRAAVHGAIIGGIGMSVGLAVVGVGTEMSDSADDGALGVVVLVLGAAVVALGLPRDN